MLSRLYTSSHRCYRQKRSGSATASSRRCNPRQERGENHAKLNGFRYHCDNLGWRENHDTGIVQQRLRFGRISVCSVCTSVQSWGFGGFYIFVSFVMCHSGMLNLVDRQPRQTKQCCDLANQNRKKQTKIGTVNRSLERVLGNCIRSVKLYKTLFSSAMVYPNAVLRTTDSVV
jgi:hypothetical protein